jgi:ligand-binding sensor domain-containing protein
MKPFLYFLVFLFTSLGILEAQTPHFQHYFLTRRNEPAQVNKMFQSREGYLWFATTKGLFRFDGHQFKVFTSADSLPDPNVTAIAQDSLGRIWTAHASGKISWFDGKRFQLFKPKEGLSPAPVSDILFDNNNVLWFSTLNDGLYYFRNERLYRVDDQEGLPDLYVYDVEQGEDGKIYAGTDGGMAICELSQKDIKIDVINHKDGLSDNIIRKIHTIDATRLLLGTEDDGLISYDLKSKSFTKISVGVQLNSISDIVVKSDRAWISSAKSGLTVIDLKTSQAKHYGKANNETIPIISSLLVDKEFNIWAASRNGIFRTLGDELEFISLSQKDMDPNVMAVARDRDGAIWFSTQDGLFKRTQTAIGEHKTSSPLAGTSFSRYRVISLYVDDEGFLWAGLYGEGVLRIDPTNNKTRLLSKELRNGNVLHISGKGKTVWLATLGGAEKIDVTGDKLLVTHYSEENGLSSDFIYQVHVDTDGRAWFATDGKGVDMLDAKGIHHLDSGLISKVVYGFAEDANGTIWANTQDAGIFYFDGEKFIDARQDSIAFREANNFVLTTDQAGRIIAMHNSGIDIYDVTSKEIRYLDEQSGLDDHIVNLNSFYKDGSDLLFGTSNGIVDLGFNPQGTAFPKIHIEGISMVGQKDYLDVTNELNYNQNNLTMRFRGFWFQNPDDVTFAYKMDDYDAEWIVTGDDNITYSQLPAGSYTFRVRSASSAPGSESIIYFQIRPPFWKTAAFAIFVIALSALLIYAYIKYRERSLKEAKLLLEEKVEERTQEIQKNVEEIQAQNEEIMAQAEEINGINENLEMLVHERTAELEKKNTALEEYAFINAHKLRSPVASILGLVNLLNKAEMNDDCKVINRHLLNSADELDGIVRSITKAIERGDRK